MSAAARGVPGDKALLEHRLLLQWIDVVVVSCSSHSDVSILRGRA
jgi:hypothetical protein